MLTILLCFIHFCVDITSKSNNIQKLSDTSFKYKLEGEHNSTLKLLIKKINKIKLDLDNSLLSVASQREIMTIPTTPGV